MNLFEKLSASLASAEKGETELLDFYTLLWNNGVLLKPDQYAEILAKAKKVSQKSAQVRSWFLLSEGFMFTFFPNYGNAFEKLSECIELFKQLSDLPGEGAAQCLLAIYYKNVGELGRAQEIIQNGIQNLNGSKIFGYFFGIAYYQSGEIHHLLKDNETAIHFYNKGIEYADSGAGLGARLLNALGIVCVDANEMDRAYEYFQEALKKIEGTNNFLLESKIYADIGNYYFRKEDYVEAEKFQKESIRIRLERNLSSPLITNYIELAELYRKQNKLETALENSLLAEKLSKEYKVVIKLYQAYQITASIYEAMGETGLALEYYKKYHQCKDEVLNQESARKIKQLNMLHEMEAVQKEKEIVQLRNVVLKNALDEIEASVRYARRIQKAILPSDTSVKECLPNSFVLYKPKDIVAGDFYWMEKRNGIIIFAAADCTGHGVPGAIVSVICSNALNRSVNEFDLSDPGEILNQTCSIVLEQFEKSDEQVNDGMDISLCALDVKNKTLMWCGANNPLWIIRNGELIEYTPIKRPIGKHISKELFQSQKIALQNNDCIYVFTDGYKDQFGGPDGKKLKSSALRKLLLSVQDKSMEGQERAVEECFENWKGEFEQVDDVCVIGVKFE